MVKSSTKPDAWTLSPQMTAAPELWRGCLLLLPLWEGIGTLAKDASPSGNDGTKTANPSWTTTKNGTAMSFNGTGHVFGDLVLDGTKPHTWSWWSYTDTVEQKWMWATGTLELDTGDWAFGPSGTNGEFRAYTGGSTVRWIGNAGDVVAGEWQHWAVTYNGAAVARVYRNGVALSASSNNSDALSGVTRQEFGGQGGTFWDEWSGELDLPVVWDRELSSSEIKSLANDPFAMLRPAGF